MRKLLLAAAALAFAPLGVAAAQAGTGTAGTAAPGNQTGAVEASGKVGGTGGALPNTAARLDSTNRSGTRDSTRRTRPRRARSSRRATAHRDSIGALIPNPPAGSTQGGAPGPTAAPPR